MQKMGFTALTLNSTRTPTSSVTLPRAGDGARRCGFTFNYARYLRANVHRRGGYEAINGFCRWLNAQAEQRHLISAKAVCSIMFPALWTLFLLPNEEGEYSTRGRKISMDWVLHIKYIYCICIIHGFFSSLYTEVCSAQVQQLHKFKWQVKCHKALGSRRISSQILAARSRSHPSPQLLSMEWTRGARRI